MKNVANARFAIKDWDEKPYSEGQDLPKLTRAAVKKAFTGDIAGEGHVEYLMMYRGDGSAAFVGLDATDSRDWTTPLTPGMVITIEPKIYIPGENIAIMIEDMILVTPTGHENLSAAAPKRAAEIERAMRR